VLCRRPAVIVVVALALLGAGCGGGGGAASPAPPTTSGTVAASTVPRATTTTLSPIDGVQSFPVVAAHSDAPQSYPQVPPVGGTHNPVWVPCGYYDKAVQPEMGVHSLEHGAVWITYRSDLPQAEVDRLATLARGQKFILVSPWDDTLPTPVVATAWGLQLRLQSVTDARLVQFILLYAGHGPENAPC
jgi:hypothetical protein